MSTFRFSPKANQAHLIDWQPWVAETFAKAQAEDKPVLLSISATWCYWCHVMDETTYSDRDVQSLLGRSFIAVRVDNDHRPDINSRYNVGGWPTTAFMTPHGGLIGGATYLPPDQFLAMLSELDDAYRADKPQLYSQSRDLLGRRRSLARRVTAGPEVEEGLVDRVSRIVAGAYDSSEGGFGTEPKFTNPSILRFVLHLLRTSGEDFYAAMSRKTLDRMIASPIFDEADGGFFRHSASRDWSEPQREKLLEDNLHLARCFLDASIILGEPRYSKAAERTIDYLLRDLYDPAAGGFRGSQGAHSEYFELDAGARRLAGSPSRDPFCYTSAGALAVTVLLDASWKLGRSDLAEAALAVLHRIDSMARSGNSSHVYDIDGPGDAPSLMVDWAWLLTALLQAHATGQPFGSAEDAQGFLDRAVAVAATLVDRYFDEAGGGFFDIEADEQAVGHMQVREKPLAENMVAAQALLRLYQATRNEDYRQVVTATLSAFVETFREQGEFAADFGLAVHLFKNPMVEVTIEGAPELAGCRDLLQAAVRLDSPNLDIKTVRAAVGDETARAHVCLDTVCLPPVDNAAALADAVAGIDSQQQSPFQDIFSIFPGN